MEDPCVAFERKTRYDAALWVSRDVFNALAQALDVAGYHEDRVAPSGAIDLGDFIVRPLPKPERGLVSEAIHKRDAAWRRARGMM